MPEPVLNPDAVRLWTALLDQLIPSGAGLPSAGELGIAHDVVATLGDDGAARIQGLDEAGRFADLDADAQRTAVSELSGRETAFFPGLLYAVYTAYYRHPRVAHALGVQSQPPHPGGFDMEPTDLSLLDPVRARPPRG